MQAVPVTASAAKEFGDIASREDLRKRATSGQLAAMLDAQLPRGVRLLDAGCGSGLLTNFLAMAPWRRVVGGDPSCEAIARAEELRARLGIANASFVRTSLVRLPFTPGAFDVVVSLGALAYLPDAPGAFVHLVEKLRPGGAIVLGIPHRFARGPTASPRVARHSQDDVLAWFDAWGVEFLCGIPAPDGTPLHDGVRLFEPHARGGALRRRLSELTCMLEPAALGGLLVMVGRRKG